MEPNSTSPEAEFAPLITRFAELQKTLRLTDGAFAGRYRRHLKSEKAWKQLRDGKWRGYLKPETIRERLQAMARQIDAASSFVAEEFVPTLPFVRSLDVQFERLLGSAKDRRGLICLAPEGVGKSWWMSRAVNADAERRFYVRFSLTWRDKPFHIARGIAAKVGASVEKNPARQMESLISHLAQLGDVVLFFDEGHNGGVAAFKVAKDLIDECPRLRIFYAAFPTEFDLVRTTNIGSVGEAKQFIRRCLRPIFDDYRAGTLPGDVAEFIAQAGLPRGGDLDTVAAELAPVLRRNGNLTTLDDALDEARTEAEEREVKLSLSMVTQAVKSLCSTADERHAAEKAEGRRVA